MRPDCNHCDVGAKCKGAANFRLMQVCSRFIPINRGWKLLELTLAYPTSLNQALSALPFKVRLTDYIKGDKL